MRWLRRIAPAWPKVGVANLQLSHCCHVTMCANWQDKSVETGHSPRRSKTWRCSMTKSRKSKGLAADLVRGAQMAMEIPGAAAITISKRLPMLGEASVSPNRHGDEIHRMVSEKIAAGNLAASAMMKGISDATTVLATATARQAGVLFSLSSFGPWLSPTSMTDQAKAAGKCAEISNAAAVEGLTVAARTMVKAMTPVHRKVSANARRLARSH